MPIRSTTGARTHSPRLRLLLAPFGVVAACGLLAGPLLAASLLTVPFLSACNQQGVKVSNSAPNVSITTPANGNVFYSGAPVTFSAFVEDGEDSPEDLKVYWTSDFAGSLAESTPDADGLVTFVTDTLEVGTHLITVQVVDTAAESASESVTIGISDSAEAPTIGWVHPTSTEVGHEGNPFSFVVLAGDGQDPLLSLVVELVSSIDGPFCSFSPDAAGSGTCDADLSVGPHSLTAVVIDLDGNTGDATALYEVLAASSTDDDADGWTEQEGDCDDEDPSTNPDSTEYQNGIDDDCDGIIDDNTRGYDDDGDGQTEDGGDCDDTDPDTYQGATETCDGIDNDCNGIIDDKTPCYDDDLDGYSEDDGDCDDTDPLSYPGAPEQDDGKDNDCDGIADEGTDAYDDDGDGMTEAGGDCDDTDIEVYTGHVEVCDSKDNDCNGIADDGTECFDDDGDGTSEDGGDCDDADSSIHPSATETVDGVDQDCDGAIDEGTSAYDDDGDCFCEVGPCQGSIDASCTTVDEGDCDDGDDRVSPDATELCDGLDNDCDGATDEFDAADTGLWYRDSDGDEYGDATDSSDSCSQPVGYVLDDTDCDDSRDDVSPDASEVCDGVDNDCDIDIDEGDAADAQVWYADGDSDGYGDPADGDTACDQPSGYVADGTDCDDVVADTNPAALEYCDGVDNNCDGDVDEAASSDATVWYRDADRDSYGDVTDAATDCSAPSGYVADGTDCDDTNSRVSPGDAETCNGTDDNCDGAIDEGLLFDWFEDADSDGYGNPASILAACTLPSGYVATSTDCDDTDSGVSPADLEVCDGVDQDCDGTIDNGVGATWYEDYDGDGYGNAAISLDGCEAPAGYVENGDDCDDTDPALTGTSTWYEDADSDGFGDATSTLTDCDQPAGYVVDGTDCDDGILEINPDAPEYCDGLDNNCDGDVDETSSVDASVWYRDADRDSYGDVTDSATDCSAPSGYVSDATDCDDTNSSVSPGDVETCNGTDDNCDSAIDEGLLFDWYEDADSDGYGNAASILSACSLPSGYVATSSDCDDTDAGVSPADLEVCDGVDQDCDGTIDEGVGSTWYEDYDGDGYGNAGITSDSCDAPAGYVDNGDDCDDTDPATTRTADWYEDSDNDGFGDPTSHLTQCNQPAGYVSDATDCNDAVANSNPDGIETCDYVDNDCDGATDPLNSIGCTTYYYDGDADGYGASSPSQCACAASGAYSSTLKTDCLDSSASVHPNASSYHTTDRGDGSFDYNCNALESTERDDVYVNECFYGFCVSYTDGWAGSVAACGTSATYQAGCTGVPFVGCSATTTSTVTQGCR